MRLAIVDPAVDALGKLAKKTLTLTLTKEP
jgi:hypothetical protein